MPHFPPSPFRMGIRHRCQVRLALSPRTSHLARLSLSQDIICCILQYLQDEGYVASFLTMQDEAKIKLAEKQTQRSYFKRMRKAILGARSDTLRASPSRTALTALAPLLAQMATGSRLTSSVPRSPSSSKRVFSTQLTVSSLSSSSRRRSTRRRLRI